MWDNSVIVFTIKIIRTNFEKKNISYDIKITDFEMLRLQFYIVIFPKLSF